MFRRVEAILLPLTVLFLNCRTPNQPVSCPGGKRLRVITTSFPVYDLARFIGAEQAEVTLLLPPGVEPHGFEPKPSDVARLAAADLFIYTNRLLEPWAAEFMTSSDNARLSVVDASQGVVYREGDPHVWLDFDNARRMAFNIAVAFGQRDSLHRAQYQQRAEDYSRRLLQLDSAYKSVIEGARQRVIVHAGHFSFGYLAARYGLEYHAAGGISPDAEPSAKELAGLVERLRQQGLRYIFYEELLSPRIAQSIHQEANVQLLPLNPAGNLPLHEFTRGVTLFDIFRDNLRSLHIGLESSAPEPDSF